MLGEAIVSELADLGKTVHTFADFNEDVAIVDEGCELVLLLLAACYRREYP